MLKITWRKTEFKEFVSLKPWAFKRRRVDEMPAYLYPIGFGFSLVKPIRLGFWLDEQTGQVYAGFLTGYDNFHYVAADGAMRSDANWPEPALLPLDFRAGLRLYRIQLLGHYEDKRPDIPKAPLANITKLPIS